MFGKTSSNVALVILKTELLFVLSRYPEFSVPQIKYPLGGSSKTGMHVYFLLQVFWVILLFDINVLMLPW